MVMTVLSMCGLGMLTPNFASAAASAGDLIKMEGNSSVYYFDGAKRFVFPNETTYFSWYSDFSGVVTIPASELQSYPLGGNVTMRPGTKLVKITTDPSVYAVEANGVLRKIQNEAQAASLYGTDWAKRVVDVPDAFFTNYTIGSVLASGSIPAGSLVKNAGSSNVFYFDGSNYRAIASEAAMNANRFNFSNVLTVSNTITASGNAITGMEEALVKTSQGATSGQGQVVTGSGLMVSLNSTTPASMNIPKGVPAEFLKINLTAANDGPVNVSSIKLTAYGLSPDVRKIQEVTFYDNGVKVGNSRPINSDRIATFNFATPIYVAAGTTKTLVVKANVDADSGNYGLGIASASDIISSGASVSGSFPIQGNLMSAIEASVGRLEISAVNKNPLTPSFGEENVVLADFDLKAANTEDILLNSLSLYNGGTNANNIVTNLRLFIDGNEVTTGSYVNRYATFSLNNYQIEKGDVVRIEVKGDMGITSVNDTIELYFKDSNDIVAFGKINGFRASVDAARLGTRTEASEIKLTSGDFTIAMDKTATPAKDVKPGDKRVVLATISMKSNGENVTLSEIKGNDFYIDIKNASSSSADVIENVELVDLSTGGVYDLSASSTTEGKIELSLNDDINFVKGVEKKFALRADILDTTDVIENLTLKAELKAAALRMEGDVSGADIKVEDITPASVNGSLITIKKAALTLTPITLNDVNVVGGGTEVVYRAKVKAGNADSVRLQSVGFASTKLTGGDADNAFINSNISMLELYLDGKLLRRVSSISGTSVSFNSLDTNNNVISAGREVDLELRATFASNLTAAGFKLRVNAISSRSVDGNNSITTTLGGTDWSRNVNVASKGTLKVEMHTSDSKANKDSFLLAGSQTEAGRYLGELKFITEKEAIKVDKLTLTKVSEQTATNADIKSVKLVKADGTVVAEKVVEANADVVFDPFNVTFEADKTTSLFIVAVAKGINVAGDPSSTATAGRTIAYTRGAVQATGLNSGDAIVVDASATSSKVATIVGSKLNSITNVMSDGKLANGTRTIGEYKFVFDNGANRKSNNEELKAVLDRLVVAIDKDATTTLGTVNLYVKNNSGVKASTVTDGTDSNKIATWTTSLNTLEELDGEVTLVIEAAISAVPERGWLETSITIAGENVKYNTHNIGGNILSANEKVKGAYLAD